MNSYDKYMNFFTESVNRQSFELLPGTGRVMISAPHSVSQTRRGTPKPAEPQTGALAKLLHDRLNCPVIYKTRNYNDDANFDTKSRFKSALTEYIGANGILYLIDLHQLSPTRKININFGINSGINIKADPFLIQEAERIFVNHGFTEVFTDKPFKASYPYTVSAYTAEICNIACLQLEINSRLVYPNCPEFCFDALADTLEELISSLNTHASTKTEGDNT